MTIRSATPYLLLNGNVDRAIALYRAAFGARTEMLRRFGDADGGCPAAQKDRVMHAALRIGDALIMMSDGPGGAPGEGPAADATGGASVSVALALTDRAEARKSFEALGATGKVVQPLFDAPWGSLFGVVVDEVGVSWMFDCAAPPAG
jgi:PhnB protein